MASSIAPRLMPHDGSELSDKALAHGICLSKLSNAGIVILNALEDIHEISPTIISAGGQRSDKEELTDKTNIYESSKEDQRVSANVADLVNTQDVEAKAISKTISDSDLQVTIEGRLQQMINERISLCKDAGVKSQISYKIQTGKAVEQIVNMAKESNIDLIIMVSEKIGITYKRYYE